MSMTVTIAPANGSPTASAPRQGEQCDDVDARLAAAHRGHHRRARQHETQHGRGDPERLSQAVVAQSEGEDAEPEQRQAGDELEDLAVLA